MNYLSNIEHGYTVNMHGDVTGNLIRKHLDPRYKIPRWSVTREFGPDDQISWGINPTSEDVFRLLHLFYTFRSTCSSIKQAPTMAQYKQSSELNHGLTLTMLPEPHPS